mgnify:CR=1 FL=1
MHGVLIGAILVLSLLGMPIGYALGSATLLALLYNYQIGRASCRERV